ncbi:MAG: hypothetical protein JWN40_5961 [Phycisphaerales bacterium]|nr:hypothetical protein [Phycisphaerales bacterium]
MAMTFTCKCGEVLEADASDAGQRVQCPSCGAVATVPAASSATPVQTLGYAGGGAASVRPGGPIAPPPSDFVLAPTSIPEKLRSPGMPPCYLVLSTDGAHVNAQFDVSPVMDALAESFAKKLRKRYDVQIVAAAPDASSPSVFIRLVRIDEGNRFLRYFLTLFAGKTVLELEGEVQSASGKQMSIHETHKGTAGFLGGGAINLLKASGKYLGTKIAKKALK